MAKHHEFIRGIEMVNSNNPRQADSLSCVATLMGKWVLVEDRLPDMLVPVEVIAEEHGFDSIQTVAKYWQSSQKNSEPQWWLPKEYHGSDRDYLLAFVVTTWRGLIPLQEELLPIGEL